MLLMGGEDKSDDEGQEQGVDTMDTQIVADVEDLQSSASACSSNITTPPPLTPCTRPAPGKRMHYKKDAVEEKLLQIIGKPEKEPDEDEIFCLGLATLLRKIKDPQKKGVHKVAVAADNVQLYVWFITAQCRSDTVSTSTSSYAYVTPSAKLQLWCKY